MSATATAFTLGSDLAQVLGAAFCQSIVVIDSLLNGSICDFQIFLRIVFCLDESIRSVTHTWPMRTIFRDVGVEKCHVCRIWPRHRESSLIAEYPGTISCSLPTPIAAMPASTDDELSTRNHSRKRSVSSVIVISGVLMKRVCSRSMFAHARSVRCAVVCPICAIAHMLRIRPRSCRVVGMQCRSRYGTRNVRVCARRSAHKTGSIYARNSEQRDTCMDSWTSK
jgi:hypothetical protein